MDSDFWASRLAAAKRQLNLHHHHHHQSSSSSSHLSSQFDQINLEDLVIEEETRPDYPCPYCYEEFDIASLCYHLEDEHSFESRVTVCPVCSFKVAGDILSHITLQHGHLLKLQRRRRLRRIPVPSSQALSLLGRDLREAHRQMLLGGSGYRSNSTSTSSATTDPFLSSLVLNLATSEAEEISKSIVSNVEDTATKSIASQPIWKSSLDPSLSYEERQQRIRQAAGRAVFLQDLLFSTLSTE